MPYLKYSRKQALDKGKVPETPGDLTYLLSKELLRVTNGREFNADYGPLIDAYLGKTPNFARYAEALGAIQATTFEFIRRKGLLHPWEREEVRKLELYAHSLYILQIGPYEDTKIAENGDIFVHFYDSAKENNETA